MTAPATNPTVDNALSHTRNVQQILELAAEWTRNVPQLRGNHSGCCYLQRHELAEITNRLGAVVELLKVPAPTDPAQLAVLIEDFRPKQLVLLDVVPPLCAPAFQRGA